MRTQACTSSCSSGAGRAFCAGYDLMHYAQSATAPTATTQDMPWDPMKDYALHDAQHAKRS